MSLAEGPREYLPIDYEQVLTRWTRTEHLVALSELDDLLTVTATFESWDFRAAYGARYAQDYRLSAEQQRTMYQTSLDDSRTHHQFFVALYGGNRRWNDLSRPNSAWIVRLVDDTGRETPPDEIIAIPKPGPIEKSYFPYVSVFRQVFRIRFPTATANGPVIANDAHLVGLKFSGAQGSEELHWTLR